MKAHTIAELIIADAHRRGLRHFFGSPGGGTLDLIDAGRRFGVEFVSVAHESSGAIMAAYNGALKGTAGIAVAIKGVGAGNLAGGACNVYFERFPLVALCDCAPTMWQQEQTIQKIPHEALFGGFTKKHVVLTPEDAPELLQQAIATSVDGRPGPVLVDVPTNLSGANCGDPLDVASPKPSPAPGAESINAASDFLKRSQRLVVIAGADVVRGGATAELAAFVDAMGATVLTTTEARGVFPETHPRWAGVLFGMYGPNLIETEIFCRADSILLVGVDAMMTEVPWKLSLPTCELVARAEYRTLSKPAVRVDGDLKTSLQRLTGHRQAGFQEDDIRSARAGILVNFKRPAGARFAAQDVIEITRRLLPDDGILFTETGAFVLMLETLWPVKIPNTYFGTSGGRTMGLMVPAILGAKLAQPDRPMVGIGGDGSLRMRLGELEVFARTGARVPLVIINDEALGTIKWRQKYRGLTDHALSVHSVDFAAIARACGLNGVTVHDPEAFEKELRRAMKADRATLIDARVDAKVYQDSFGPTTGVL